MSSGETRAVSLVACALSFAPMVCILDMTNTQNPCGLETINVSALDVGEANFSVLSAVPGGPWCCG